jgi:hypothetical protein
MIFLRHFYFQLYDGAFKRNTEIPSYWHKNFALVCERMLHIESEFDKTDMLKKVILHFELFLMQDPTDSDSNAIKSVVKTMKKQLKSLS